MISKLFSWLSSQILGSKSIRIDPDHLPGLRAPKPMPFRPPLPREEKQQKSETLADTYERFKQSRTKGAPKRKSDWNF
jgi:hypothetical protein